VDSSSLENSPVFNHARRAILLSELVALKMSLRIVLQLVVTANVFPS
jgi:hypothetical protein